MNESASSRTALGVAMMRAVHQLIDGEPRILNDPIALAMFDRSTVEAIRDDPGRFQERWARALRSQVVVRSRYAEDRLSEAVSRGVSQYVILGAGYDSFAYRQPAWAAHLRIFEVDQPASQAAKLACLEKSGIARPSNLTCVGINFEHESLASGLARSGFDPREMTFLSALGVLMYLTPEAVDALFAFVASLPRGSEIVFTFAVPEGSDGEVSASIAQMAEAAGEPWLSRFDPDVLLAKLRTAGFSQAHLLEREEIVARYFRNRSDGLPPPRGRRIGSAVV